MSKNNGMPSRLGRCVKAPLRMLRSACDAYVRGLNSCADRAGRTAPGIGYGYSATTAMPRSYSLHSSASSTGSDDLRELIRAASVARGGGRFGAPDPGTVPRSQSVAVGRIDEDTPCDFPDDVKVGSNLLVSRSRSVAVVGPKRRKVRSYI